MRHKILLLSIALFAITALPNDQTSSIDLDTQHHLTNIHNELFSECEIDGWTHCELIPRYTPLNCALEAHWSELANGVDLALSLSSTQTNKPEYRPETTDLEIDVLDSQYFNPPSQYRTHMSAEFDISHHISRMAPQLNLHQVTQLLSRTSHFSRGDNPYLAIRVAESLSHYSLEEVERSLSSPHLLNFRSEISAIVSSTRQLVQSSQNLELDTCSTIPDNLRKALFLLSKSQNPNLRIQLLTTLSAIYQHANNTKLATHFASLNRRFQLGRATKWIDTGSNNQKLEALNIFDRYAALYQLEDKSFDSQYSDSFVRMLFDRASRANNVSILRKLLETRFSALFPSKQWYAKRLPRSQISNYDSLLDSDSKSRLKTLLQLINQPFLDKIRKISTPDYANFYDLMKLIANQSSQRLLLLAANNTHHLGELGLFFFDRLVYSKNETVVKQSLLQAVTHYGGRTLKLLRPYLSHDAILQEYALKLMSTHSDDFLNLPSYVRKEIEEFISANPKLTKLNQRLTELLKKQISTRHIPAETLVRLPNYDKSFSAKAYIHYQPDLNCRGLTKFTCITTPNCFWVPKQQKAVGIQELYWDAGKMYPKWRRYQDSCESYLSYGLNKTLALQTPYLSGLPQTDLTLRPLLPQNHKDNIDPLIATLKPFEGKKSYLVYHVESHHSYWCGNGNYFSALLASLDPKSGTQILLVDNTCSGAADLAETGSRKTFLNSTVLENTGYLLSGIKSWSPKTSKISIYYLSNMGGSDDTYSPRYFVRLDKTGRHTKIVKRGPQSCYANNPKSSDSTRSCGAHGFGRSHRCFDKKKSLVAETCVCDPFTNKCQWKHVTQVNESPFWIATNVEVSQVPNFQKFRIEGALQSLDKERNGSFTNSCDFFDYFLNSPCIAKGVATAKESYVLSPKLWINDPKFDSHSLMSRWIAASWSFARRSLDLKQRCPCLTQSWKSGVTNCEITNPTLHACRFEMKPKPKPESVRFGLEISRVEDQLTDNEIVLTVSKNKQKPIKCDSKKSKCHFISKSYQDAFQITLQSFDSMPEFYLSWITTSGSTCALSDQPELKVKKPKTLTWKLSKRRLWKDHCLLQISDLPTTESDRPK